MVFTLMTISLCLAPTAGQKFGVAAIALTASVSICVLVLIAVILCWFCR